MASLSRTWELAWSEEHRRYYYMNRSTGKSQWKRPEGCSLDADNATKQVEDERLRASGNSSKRPTGGSSQKLDLQKVQKYPEVLPKGWEAHLDRPSGKWYFYNKASKARTWYKPVMPTSSADRAKAEDDQHKAPDAGEPKLNPQEAEGKKKKNEDLLRTIHDPQQFLDRLEAVEDNRSRTRELLAELKEHNDEYLQITLPPIHIPTTVPVTYSECIRSLIDRQLQGYRMKPSITISERTIAQAIQFFANDPKRVVCGLNFAEGRKEHFGLGYKEGRDGVEEDLCRRCSALFNSLNEAAKSGYYDFGPSTCIDESQPEKYCDVLFTPRIGKDKYGVDADGLKLTRGRIEEGFPFLNYDECRRICLVSAAAPIAKAGSGAKTDIVDTKLLFNLITTIFVAPVLKEPACTTLILGAWGCGKEGNNPVQIAQLFAQAITRKLPSLDLCLGNLYHEIHFAIPAEPDENKQHRIFFQVFEKNNIQAAII